MVACKITLSLSLSFSMADNTPQPTFSPKEIFAHAWTTLEAELGHGKVIFPAEIIWLNGTPGAGKGTNSQLIVALKGFKTPSIEMSSLFKTPEVKKLIDAGVLIDDKTATVLLFEALTKPRYHGGVVMDGYPRTAAQGEILKLLFKKLQEQGTPSKFEILELVVDEETSVARQLKRGREQQAAGKEVRATDLDPAVAHKRYKVFIEQTYTPLKALGTVFPFYSLETLGTFEEVKGKIAKALGE